MIADARGNIDYEEVGVGPTVLLVLGSCSTGAAWRPVIGHLAGRLRTITTTLPGYGRTTERRSTADASIEHVAEMLESIVMHADAPVHLVGHSFGGLAGLAVAMRKRVRLASLMVLKAPAPTVLNGPENAGDFDAFNSMTDAYAADFANGNVDAIGTMIDFYGGAGTFAGWPEAVRAYAMKTTPSNLLDWASAYGFEISTDVLAGLKLSVHVTAGSRSHPSVIRANRLIGEAIGEAQFTLIEDTAHFMIATHAGRVAELIVEQVATTASRSRTAQDFTKDFPARPQVA